MGCNTTTNHKIRLDITNVNLDAILCFSCCVVRVEQSKYQSFTTKMLCCWLIEYEFMANISFQTEVDIISDIDEYQTWPGWLVLVSRFVFFTI